MVTQSGRVRNIRQELFRALAHTISLHTQKPVGVKRARELFAMWGQSPFADSMNFGEFAIKIEGGKG